MPRRTDCTHCGHTEATPCHRCRRGHACLGLCWACQVESEADPFETDEAPRVHHHPDGAVTCADLGDVPQPSTHLPPLDESEIPF